MTTTLPMHQKTKDLLIIVPLLVFNAFMGAVTGLLLSVPVFIAYIFACFLFADTALHISRFLFDEDGWYLLQVGVNVISTGGLVIGAIMGIIGTLKIR